MGIRFSCPNGHTLHVKAFLAGKRGICPKCGVKLTIPQVSDERLSEDLRESIDEDQSLRTLDRLSDDLVKLVREPQQAGTPPFRSNSLASDASDGVLPAIQPVGEPGTTLGQQSKRRSADPMSTFASNGLQNPSASVWYVRPPQGGGQFGPASAEVMQAWITEGRVPPDAHLWSPGWPEWRVASAVIPVEMLEAAGRLLKSSASAAQSTVPADALTLRTGTSGTAAMMYQRRQSQRWSRSTVTWLAIFCAVLFAALLYVVFWRGSPG